MNLNEVHREVNISRKCIVLIIEMNVKIYISRMEMYINIKRGILHIVYNTVHSVNSIQSVLYYIGHITVQLRDFVIEYSE